MKFKNLTLSLLIVGTALLGACKKDTDNSAKFGNVIVTAKIDDDNDPNTPLTGFDNGIVSLYVDGDVNKADILADRADSEKMTNSDGEVTISKVLPGTYAIQVDDGNIATVPKVIQVAEGDNKVSVSIE